MRWDSFKCLMHEIIILAVKVLIDVYQILYMYYWTLKIAAFR